MKVGLKIRSLGTIHLATFINFFYILILLSKFRQTNHFKYFFLYLAPGLPNHEYIVEFMNKNYKPNFTYADFAPDFKAEFYDPVYWAKLFSEVGAK